MVALAVGQAEQPFFQNRIAAIPERDSETQRLCVVAQSGDAVFAPAVGSRARMVVREIVPGVAVLAVVLTHSAPLPFAEIGSPLLPWRSLLTGLRQARAFRVIVVRRVGLVLRHNGRPF